MKSFIILFCFLVCAFALHGQTAEDFDKPLRFSRAEEVYLLAVKPPRAWHPHFGDAMTYLTLNAPGRDTRLSVDERDALLVRIADGRSPRELMILGLTFRVELLRMEHDSDSRAASEKHRPDEEREFFKLRASRSAAELEHDYRMLKDLLHEEPNKQPQQQRP
jgi:hypothetical protein